MRRVGFGAYALALCVATALLNGCAAYSTIVDGGGSGCAASPDHSIW